MPLSLYIHVSLLILIYPWVQVPRWLSMHHTMKINPDSFQSFVDMEKEMLKEMNKGKNRKKKEKNDIKLI